MVERASNAIPKRPSKWAKYKVVWEKLDEQGFQPKEAAQLIGEWDNLSDDEIAKLENQIRQWKFKKTKK